MADPPMSLLDLPLELVQLVADALVCKWVEAAKEHADRFPDRAVAARQKDADERALRIAKQQEAGRTVCGMLAFRATCKRGYALVKPWTAPTFCSLLAMDEGMDPRYARFALGHLLLWKQTRVPKMNLEQHMHVHASCTAAMCIPYCWNEVAVAQRLSMGAATKQQPRWVEICLRDTLTAKKKWRALGMAIINRLMQEYAEAWGCSSGPYVDVAADHLAQERREADDRARRALKLIEYADRHNNSVLSGSERSLRTHYEMRKHELHQSTYDRRQHIARHGFESS